MYNAENILLMLLFAHFLTETILSGDISWIESCAACDRSNGIHSDRHFIQHVAVC